MLFQENLEAEGSFDLKTCPIRALRKFREKDVMI
jgi:hypothetical protein